MEMWDFVQSFTEDVKVRGFLSKVSSLSPLPWKKIISSLQQDQKFCCLSKCKPGYHLASLGVFPAAIHCRYGPHGHGPFQGLRPLAVKRKQANRQTLRPTWVKEQERTSKQEQPQTKRREFFVWGF